MIGYKGIPGYLDSGGGGGDTCLYPGDVPGLQGNPGIVGQGGVG